MVLTLAGIVTDVKLLHPQKALLPMLLTLLPIDNVVIFSQYQNAASPIESTPSGIKRDIKLQEAKADGPMYLTLLGMAVEERLSQP